MPSTHSYSGQNHLSAAIFYFQLTTKFECGTSRITVLYLHLNGRKTAKGYCVRVCKSFQFFGLGLEKFGIIGPLGGLTRRGLELLWLAATALMVSEFLGYGGNWVTAAAFFAVSLSGLMSFFSTIARFGNIPADMLSNASVGVNNIENFETLFLAEGKRFTAFGLFIIDEQREKFIIDAEAAYRDLSSGRK